MSMAFSPDGRILATGGYNKSIQLWDTTTGLQRPVAEGRFAPIVSIAFSADGKMIASASEDKSIGIWGVKPF